MVPNRMMKRRTVAAVRFFGSIAPSLVQERFSHGSWATELFFCMQAVNPVSGLCLQAQILHF
jgi:hypothetical protein